MPATGNRMVENPARKSDPTLPARPVIGPAIETQPIKPPPDAGLQPMKPKSATPAVTDSALTPMYNQGGGQTTGDTSATPTEGKVYTYEEMEAYQQDLTAQDKALWDAGEKFYRNDGYTATPNERTIQLQNPIYGDLLYYDPGERIYEGQGGTPQTAQGSGVRPTATRPTYAAGVQTNAGGGDLTSLLEEWKKAAAEQANGQIDYAVSQAITQLERALEDSKAQYKEQAESVARDERQAMDNSALYAEMRGDKGGIGQAQYNEIQAAAAQNRLAVQQAQTKLATDTARQIADLRAQGEFEKADKALEITQTYLSQLISLEQWAAEFGLSREQFQASLVQWQKEYEMAMEEFKFNKATTERGHTASMAEALMAAGVPLDDEQLKAIGWSRDQYNDYLRKRELEAAAGGGGFKMPSTTAELYRMLQQEGVTTAEQAKAQLAVWGVTSPGNYVGGFEDWLKSQSKATDADEMKYAREIVSRLRANGATMSELWLELDSMGLSDETKLALVEEFNIEP